MAGRFLEYPTSLLYSCIPNYIILRNTNSPGKWQRTLHKRKNPLTYS